ncbi:uncharacterized protein [Nicotiana tomentosiformis]|uniref:uncharacterized protein n=1 Tax=Nicotiana tomentosiformis TaxID=4098 RepID=UPI00388CDE91
MPAGYQPPKFQQFDGKGNPKQHVENFVETCNNAGTYEDYLIKQFVRSLKGNAFDWYTDLEAGSIDSWDQLEQEFLNRFYSTRCTMSMIELTNTRQRKGKPVIDFINHWRNANLNCKDRLSEASGIEMCIQGMHWGLSYIFQGINPRTFEELATRAHDMELSMAPAGNERLPIYEPRKGNDKQEVRKWGNFVPKPESKEDMNVNTSLAKLTTKVSKKQSMKSTSFQDKPSRKLTLKGMQEKEYPFLDSDVPAIFEEHLELNLIELPEMKRPNEARKTNDPNYCKYYRLVSHPLEKCFFFKDKVMDLAREKKIVLEDEKASTNQVSITFGSFRLDKLYGFKESKDEELPENDKAEVNQPDNDEGWILVTRRRHHRRSPRKESVEKPTRKMMVKRPRRWNPVKHLKKAKVEVNHSQKPLNPVTLEEFLPSWFRMKISHGVIDASCCHADEGKEKSDDLPLAPSSEKLIESTPQEVNAFEEKVTFTNDDILLGDTLHNRPLYPVCYMRDERVNRILVDGGSSVNILPIRTVKELGIPRNELSERRVMIQGFNQGRKRDIGAIRMEIIIEDMQSSTWLHVIDAKTSYNVLLGRPWIHENKVAPSTYHQCLKYYEGEVEKKIIVDDEPFTEAESHFVDAKFYLKNRIVKELKADDVMNDKDDESTTKRVEVIADKTKVVAEKVHPNQNKSHKGNIMSHSKKVTHSLQYVPKKKKDEGESSNLQTNMLKGLTLPVKQIEAIKSSSIPLAGFVAQNYLQNVALPIKRTDEDFDPNAYRLFAKLDTILMKCQS